MSGRILVGDALEHLRTLPDASVQCCVTSPPYYGLRDYGVAGQLGLEPTPAEYVAKMVAVFREVRRVLRDDGTLWLNVGDSYCNAGSSRNGEGLDGKQRGGARGEELGYKKRDPRHAWRDFGIKHKDLIGIPWMLAFALRDDGWYLRSDIIWSKPNPMPESVTDRPTKAHEYVFLLSKRERYYYDAEAIAEPAVVASRPDGRMVSTAGDTYESLSGRHDGSPEKSTTKGFLKRSGNKARKAATERGCPSDGVAGSVPWEGTTRNKRSVWPIATQPFPGSHFATMPPDLAETCIKAGSAKGATVLDPFGGAGTTGLLADRLGRDYLLCELNPKYAEMAARRIHDDAPLFAAGGAAAWRDANGWVLA